jgi:low temperature requirement protein LtrA
VGGAAHWRPHGNACITFELLFDLVFVFAFTQVPPSAHLVGDFRAVVVGR